MEDVIDTFLVRVDDDREPTDNPSKLKRLLEKMGNLLGKGKARRQIANAIKEINNRVQEVANRHGRYTLDRIVAKPAATSTIDPRVLAMYKDVAQLIGVDGPRDALIKMLSEGGDDASKKKMKIVSIVGFGGLGKTTLAKVVYDKLKADFDCTAFVPVGQNPGMKKVFRDILIDLDKQKYMNFNWTILDERQLINELRQFLENKRYFIVIDDLWDEKSWDTIRCALADSCCGSRIVATTRISKVAKYVGDVYELQPLSRDNSEELFNIRLVDCEGKCPHNQSTEVYDKILKKCSGVPLAIITIACLLASKQAEDWSEVYNSIGFGHADHAENTRKILSFSYYDLPSHLRTCLLYLSLAPEDYWIDKNKLIWKWIAEGFVHEEQGIGLLEVGETYFNELVNRSMILPMEDPEVGYLDGCRVHDMVLDLVRSLSGEENFATILNNRQPTFQRSSNARRLALHSRLEDQNPLADMGVQHVRSFFAFLCSASMVVSPSFRVLRVLCIEFCDFREGENGLEHLRNLPQLRYLGLIGTPVGELPKEIGRLKSLQTLDLIGSSIEELPSSVSLLTQLMCLRADLETRVPPDCIGNLTALQELWIWPATDRSTGFVKELGSLRELRVLVTEIDVSSDECLERALVEFLGNLRKIQIVYIAGKTLGKGATWEAGFVSPRRLRCLHLGCLEFSRLPAWINSSLLPNLSTLEVEVQVVQEQDMETLGRLPELCVLYLWSKYTLVVSIIGGDGRHLFHKLRSLWTSLAFLFRVQRVHGVAPTTTTIMPSLESLEFHVPVRFLRDGRHLFHKLRSLETDLACDFRVQRVHDVAPTTTTIMPSLESLDFRVPVRYLKDANLGFDKFHKVTARIDCRKARAAEVEEAEAALPAVHPTLQMKRIDEDQMLPSDEEAEMDSKIVHHDLNAREQKDENNFFNFCWLLKCPCVETFSVSIDCEDAWLEEVEEAEAALVHSRRPSQPSHTWNGKMQPRQNDAIGPTPTAGQF